MWMVESELKEIVIDNNIKYSNILYIMHMYIYIYIHMYVSIYIKLKLSMFFKQIKCKIQAIILANT